MAPFDPPTAVLGGFKERPESLFVQENRLYIGTATGNIYIYDLNEGTRTAEEASPAATLVETKIAISRRAIDEIGYIKDINSLVVLSETLPTLYPLPSFSPPTKLAQAKSALSFAIHSSVHDVPRAQSPGFPGSRPSGGFSSEAERPIPIPTTVTSLVVGCRRKVVVYTWRDGDAQEVKETPLPHSPRAVAFLSPSHVCFAYSPTEYAVFSLEASTVVDVAMPTLIPTAPSSSGLGMGAFSGLSSYMSLGLGGKNAKPCLARIGERVVVVVRENQGFVVDVDAKTKGNSISWPSQPEEIAFVNPYIFSILPAGTVPAAMEPSNNLSSSLLPGGSSSLPQATAQSQTQSPFIQAPVIQIISSINMLPVQTIPFPFPQASNSPNGTNAFVASSSIRLLSTSITSSRPSTTLTPPLKVFTHLFLVSTPLDRALAASEGTSVWKFTMRDWDSQIEELISQTAYNEALALQDHVYGSNPNPKRTLILALNAVSRFRSGKYDDAINTFLDLDVNPAKVIALYPERVAGRLAVKQEEWIAMFGGPASQAKEPSGADIGRADDAISTKSSDGGSKDGAVAHRDKLLVTISRSPSPANSVRARTKTSFGALLPSAVSKEDDVASMSGKKKGKVVDDATRALETLWRYLTSLRPKLAGALASHHITPSQSHLFPTLSSTSPASLYALPSGVALTDLTEDELVKRAQIVDTALFKSYLIGRPSMLGPLCRLPNWCEVVEVEEELRTREKHAELIFLYNGRKMHAKALKLLQQLSEREDDVRDKLGPSVSYLRKLGPEYLDLIFESARWVFEQDRNIVLEIFTSDDVELPRDAVTDYLEKLEPHIAARYLEYLIDEKEEQNASFHDRLAELYLGITMAAKRDGEEDKRAEVYGKLLRFIDTTEHYRPDRLYGLLSEDLYEARAVLLGRMGRHEHALELYVYKLADYAKAEEHCKRISSPSPIPSPIFLTLLKLYLRPTTPNPPNLLSPALSLIARHSARLDPIETLQLLPPLVNARDVRPFLVQSLRAPVFDNCVIREVSLARREDVEMELMKLESRRVKVTDNRICPQCHKRLGNSVIAVHAPRGEVTHYQCRETFSRKLNTTRQG